MSTILLDVCANCSAACRVTLAPGGCSDGIVIWKCPNCGGYTKTDLALTLARPTEGAEATDDLKGVN